MCVWTKKEKSGGGDSFFLSYHFPTGTNNSFPSFFAQVLFIWFFFLPTFPIIWFSFLSFRLMTTAYFYLSKGHWLSFFFFLFSIGWVSVVWYWYLPWSWFVAPWPPPPLLLLLLSWMCGQSINFSQCTAHLWPYADGGSIKKLNTKMREKSKKKLRLCCCCCNYWRVFFPTWPISLVSFFSCWFYIVFIVFLCGWRGFRHTSTTAYDPTNNNNIIHGGGIEKPRLFDTDLSSLCKNFVGYRS